MTLGFKVLIMAKNESLSIGKHDISRRLKATNPFENDTTQVVGDKYDGALFSG